MSMLLQAHKERIGRQIRKARKHAGLSHDALGARVGTSRQHLIKLEKGMHLPSDALLARISEATGKDVSFFASEDDESEARVSPVEDLKLAFASFLESIEKQAMAHGR